MADEPPICVLGDQQRPEGDCLHEEQLDLFRDIRSKVCIQVGKGAMDEIVTSEKPITEC